MEEANIMNCRHSRTSALELTFKELVHQPVGCPRGKGTVERIQQNLHVAFWGFKTISDEPEDLPRTVASFVSYCTGRNRRVLSMSNTLESTPAAAGLFRPMYGLLVLTRRRSFLGIKLSYEKESACFL